MTRTLIYVLIAFLLITISSPLLRTFGIEVASIDFALIIVLHTAMMDQRGGVFRGPGRLGVNDTLLDWQGVVTALLVGYLSDLLGGGVKGIHSLCLGAVFLVARLMATHIYLAGRLSQILVTVVASIAASLIGILVRWMIGVTPGLAIVVVILGQAGLTAALAPLVMRLLRLVDARLSPDSGERSGLQL